MALSDYYAAANRLRAAGVRDRVLLISDVEFDDLTANWNLHGAISSRRLYGFRYELADQADADRQRARLIPKVVRG